MRIGKGHLSEIIEHCRSEYPDEACGILAGRGDLVARVYRMSNTSESRATCYFMDPAEQFRVFKDMRNLGMELVGIYHSHAYAPAYPSARDRELAFYAEAGYLIVSLVDSEKPEIRSFKISEGKVEEEKILVAPDADS